MNQKKDQQLKRLRYCLLICQPLNSNYDSTSPFAEVGNYSAIDYTLNWLSENSIEEVFMFYSTLKNQIEQYCQTVAKSIDLKLRLNYIKPTEMKSFGDVMREARFRDLVSEDFLVMYADSLTNLNLSQIINFHFDKKAELRNVVLTSVMRRGQSSQLMILNSSTSQILQVQQNGKQFNLNTQKVNLKKLNTEFRRDLVHSEIFICSLDVLKSFKQTEEHQNMHDFIVGMLTSEVYQEKILAYELKPQEIALRINRASNAYLAYMNFICGYLYPYSLYSDERMSKIQKTTDKVFTVSKYHKVYRKGAKVSDSVKLSNNVYIGQNSSVEANCFINKSVIGKNVEIGKRSTLHQCMILDGVKIAENSHFQYCLLEKTGPTVKIHNFKSELFDQPVQLISRQIFESTPEPEEPTFQQQLKHLLGEKNEDETIVVSELVRIRKEFQKSEAELTKEIIKVIGPKGIKGIQALTDEWGSVLRKVHHDEEGELMDSLFFSCSGIQDYSKAFHIFLQYFYGYDILTKDSIIYWTKSCISDSPTLKLCQPFIEKLEEQSEDEVDDQDS